MRFLLSYLLAVAAVATALPHGPDDDALAVQPTPSTPQYSTTTALPSAKTYGGLPHLSIADFRMPHPTPKPFADKAKAYSDAAACTTTVLGPLKMNNLTVCTSYESTSTVTEEVNCGACTAIATRALGPGPVVRCLSRTTVAVKTETVMACRK